MFQIGTRMLLLTLTSITRTAVSMSAVTGTAVRISTWKGEPLRIAIIHDINTKSALKKDAENAMLWFTEYFMQANPTKVQFMIMQKYTDKEIIPDSIEINGTTIMRQTEVKLLDITINQKLKFEKHIDNLCINAARQINIMYKFKGIFDLKEREIICNTFILAHFNYCPMVWHFCGKLPLRKSN